MQTTSAMERLSQALGTKCSPREHKDTFTLVSPALAETQQPRQGKGTGNKASSHMILSLFFPCEMTDIMPRWGLPPGPLEAVRKRRTP